MSHVVTVLIVLLGLLLTIGMDVSGLIGALAVLWIVAIAFNLMIRGKLPEHFFSLLIGLLVGPLFLCCMFRALLNQFGNLFSSGLSGTTFVFVLLTLMAASFLYVRARLRAGRQHHQRELHTNERQPLPPLRLRVHLPGTPDAPLPDLPPRAESGAVPPLQRDDAACLNTSEEYLHGTDNQSFVGTNHAP
jgi:hypothetical protein